MKFLEKIDWWILLPSITIFTLGVTILLSIAPQLFLNQVIFGIFALVIFLFVSQIDYKIYHHFNWLFYLTSVLFLILTFILGVATRGSVLWIDLGIVKLQPSEIIKPLMIVFAASFFSQPKESLLAFFKQAILFFVPVFLILRQPDLGSAIVFFVFGIGLLFTSGYKPKLAFLSVLTIFIFLPFFWRFLKDYQKERIVSFLDPAADPLGIGYNVIQAMVAVGSGGVFGRGLGRGTQSHLLFLPEYQTDFIFASFSEELGLMGGLILILLYAILLFRILKIAYAADDSFAKLIAYGVFFIIFVQVVVNIGMNMGLFPITGITLPLVSYGGSSLVSLGILLGMASNLSRSIKEENYLTIR